MWSAQTMGYFYFYPRPPRGGRPPHYPQEDLQDIRFLSTPSARRATAHGQAFSFAEVISIHALREEGDNSPCVAWEQGHSISIHALREEGDRKPRNRREPRRAFLSTPSARRATTGKWTRYTPAKNFYPRPPRGGRLQEQVRLVHSLVISIHALREEGDRKICVLLWMTGNFYPRPPRGGRRRPFSASPRRRTFLSTPSARRATAAHSAGSRRSTNFYPRPPRGGRRRCFAKAYSARLFLSTPSARRATLSGLALLVALFISIHALREEGDAASSGVKGLLKLFLSTPSARRATPADPGGPGTRSISIHALREEGDAIDHGIGQRNCDFYPRPPRGGRQQKQRQNLYFQTNYTTFCTNLEEP